MKEVLSAETKRKLAELSALEASGVAKWALYGMALCRLNGIIFTDDPEPDPKIGWQPIETAPADGTVFDVWTKYGRVTDCVRFAQFGYIYSRDPEDNCYTRRVDRDATHWMPLPPLPEETK